ncbi:ROK family protein [Vampirovibrio sp.]|uniref:ROK family protein n=1 Tax=Vampirovibrio sp. TaxID=2717857 RepID=UPI0035944E89
MKDTVVSQANPQPYHRPSQVAIGQAPIGIDIGGTKINAAVVKTNPQTGEDELLSMMNSPTPEDSETFLNTLVDMIQRLHAEHQVSGVGISTAGVVDSIHGRILGSTGNMPALKNLCNLKELLEAKIGLPVHMENDANAAAYGEWRTGAAKGAQNMFAITLGTGVGMGIVFNGQMYRGSHFYAGEGGHIAIGHKRERKCTCGRWDCWEAYASGTGLQTTAELIVEAAPETAQQEFKSKYCENGVVTTYAVIAAWKNDNHIGVQIMDEWHNHIAVGLSSLINVMDPDMIVVGGGLAQFVDFNLLLERTRERSMSHAFKLVPAALGNHAGIVGAAYLAIESQPEPLT